MDKPAQTPSTKSNTPASGPAQRRGCSIPTSLLATLLAGVLAGCGGGGGGDPAPTPTPIPLTLTNYHTVSCTVDTGATPSLTYVVGTATPLPAGAIRVAGMNDVPWATLPAGALVLVSPGNYAGVTTITATGTAAQPIIVKDFDASNPPVLGDSVDFQNTAWLAIYGMKVQSPTYSGIIIRLGSHNVTVAGSTVDSAPIGLNITGAAGTANCLLGNTVTNTATQGIGAEVNSDPAQRSLIKGNTVTGSGQHGMEIRASHYQIEYNVVSQSGQAAPGSSGIHLYSGSATEDSGDDNVVRYNKSFDNSDTTASDGNGIEADQFCDGNVIMFNQVWGNDGAGIEIYDGLNNLVQSNTAYANGKDTGGTHAPNAADIMVMTSSLNRTGGNQVLDNVASAIHSNTAAYYINTASAVPGNTIGPNLGYNSAGGYAMRWTDSSYLLTGAQMDSFSGTAGNLAEQPHFANVSAPLANGLALTSPPSKLGVAVSGALDALGNAANAAWSFFGAFFTAP